MTQEQVDRVLGLITQAAERLGFEGARLWPQMVGITFVQSLCGVIAEPVIMITILVAYLRLWRSYQRDAVDNAKLPHYVSGDTAKEMGLIFGGLGLGMLSVAIVLTWPGLLTGVLFPEATTVLRLVGK